MLKISLNGLWARKRRLAGTFLAVFLGVAFLSGTLVLGDTLRTNFDNLFSVVSKHTDAVVRSATSVKSDRALRTRGPTDQSLVARVQAVPGVAKAVPTVTGYGAVLDKKGKAVGGNGPPRVASSWISDPDLSPWRIAEGRAPAAPNEVVINRGAAKSGGLHVGDTTVVQTPDPITVHIVGIATFGSQDGMGGSTFTAFTFETAQQRLLQTPNSVSQILVKAAPGTSATTVTNAIGRALPSGTEAITGAQLTKESINAIHNTFLNMLRTFLVVFAAIALLVATFSIYNTFSILAAQRTREVGLMRAVGATRGQVLGSAVVEALVTGVLASVAGLFGGLAVAGLLKGLFDTVGFALPAGGLVFTATTALVSLIVGVLVTLIAGIAPAIRASRTRPLAALREAAAEATSISRGRVVTGAVLSAGGAAIVLAAVVANGGGVLTIAGLGALLTIVGVVVFGPVAARPATAVIGTPVARLRGITGGLARRNAMRNPRRTSGTAAALMIGVAVVTLFTVFAASLKASVDKSVTNSFGADLAVSAGSFGGGKLGPKLATDVSALPEVSTAVGLGRGAVRINGGDEETVVADTAHLGDVVQLGATDGSMKAVGAGAIAVSRKKADAQHWHVGSVVAVAFIDGRTDNLTVGAIFKNGDAVGDIVVSRQAWAPHAVQDMDTAVLVKLRPGVDLIAGKTAVQRVAAAYGGPNVQDRKEYAASVTQGISMILGLIYVLLGLAIVIAIMGIANTLSLSIHERTRELGLLRAVGQTRPQSRSMVRWEAVIMSTFGAIGGLGVGVFLGWALATVAMAGDVNAAFAVPAGQLTTVLVLGGIAGVLAGLRPARRAARMNPLAAIASS